MYGDLFDLVAKDGHKLPYIITGKVIANFDPLHPASVKVAVDMPDRDIGDNITGWARVAMPFAGGGRGTYSLPDIGDEVVLAFCSGEIDMPIVIGSLYSIVSPPPPIVLNPLNTVKCTKTRAGNLLKLDDTPGQMGVEISSVSKLGVKLDDTTMSVTVKDATSQNAVTIDGKQGSVEIKGLKGVTLKAGTCQISIDGAGQSVSIKALNVTVKADQALTLQGTQVNIKGTAVSIKADGKLEMQGPTTSVKADGNLEIKAPNAAVKADAKLELSCAGITNVKGSMLKLN